MTESTMYWITRFDGINHFFNGIETLGIMAAFVAFIALVISYIIMAIERSEGYTETDSDYVAAKRVNRTSLRVFIPAIAIAVFSAFVQVFVPTTKEMIAIKVIPAVAASEQVSKLNGIGADALDVASAWLKGQVKKLEAENNKKGEAK